MKTIKRWIKNLRWLFNNPCTSITNSDEQLQCDYCGNIKQWLRLPTNVVICWDCFKKVFDTVLKSKE
jgi:hypothetical protein